MKFNKCSACGEWFSSYSRDRLCNACAEKESGDKTKTDWKFDKTLSGIVRDIRDPADFSRLGSVDGLGVVSGNLRRDLRVDSLGLVRPDFGLGEPIGRIELSGVLRPPGLPF